MKAASAVRGVAAVTLFVVGLLASLPTPYRERTFVFEAGACHLDTAVIESKAGVVHGSVVLLHGLASNKKIMSYVARGFAAQDLRVIVPDLPGHGRTPGPFTPQRAEFCTAALLQDLFARGLAQPDTTILAGHSMGAAIALRAAEKLPIAGAIAIAPAPMRASHGAHAEQILFEGAPSALRNTLIFSGQFELQEMRANAAELVSARSLTNSKYEVVPGATHVSLIIDPRVVRRSQEWAAQLLNLNASAPLPPLRPLLAAVAGFAGLFLIVGPFLREVTSASRSAPATQGDDPPSLLRSVATAAAASLVAVLILHWWHPVAWLRTFEGDYLAVFLLLVSIALLTVHRPKSVSAIQASPHLLLRAAFAAGMLLILITGWFDLTISEAWLNAARWARFPLFLLAVLPYHLAEETLLSNPQKLSGWRRLAAALAFRLVSWLAILVGIYRLHSGEVLLALLGPYFAILCLLQRRGMDLVRSASGSIAAAALFGAILLAGFCLVIFPIT